MGTKLHHELGLRHYDHTLKIMALKEADRDADTAAAVGAVLCAVVGAKNPPAGIICFFGLAIVVRDLRSNAKWDCLMAKEDCESDCTNANRNDHGGNS